MIQTFLLYQYAYLSGFSILVGSLVGAETMVLGRVFNRRPWGWAILFAITTVIMCQLGVEFLAPPF